MTKEDKQLKKLYKILSTMVDTITEKTGHKIHEWVEVEEFIKANYVSKQWVREELIGNNEDVYLLETNNLKKEQRIKLKEKK